MDPLKIAAVIPAYNEASRIEPVIRGAARHVHAVLVVDDASTDGTAGVSRAAGAAILAHARNRGKGRSLRDGLDWGLAQGYDALLALDGDGQHLPEEIPHLLEALRSGADLVVGNRMTALETMPWVRRQTNRFMSRLVSKLAGTPVPDTQCGFRLMTSAFWRAVGPTLRTVGFDFESEILINGGRMGFRIASARVSTVYGEEASHIRPLRDTVRFFRMVLRKWREGTPQGVGFPPSPERRA
ncbi:MAG: glycosyltransferase family 2 protein [Planctomycetota bacterium]